MDMEHSCVQLIDLPDELLMFIFKKLTNTDVLYSMMGVNVWFDKVTSDPIFTSQLTLMRRSSNGLIYPMVDLELDRFCSQILPKIHHRIKRLNLESLSMEHILLAAEYPNLCELGLFNIGCEIAERVFIDCVFKNQISTLIITISHNKTEISTENVMKILCNRIISIFTNLRCLKFELFWNMYIDDVERLTFSRQSPTFYSSTLMELYINVEYFIDCLHLLDGRFNQLRTFEVNVHLLVSFSLPIVKKEKLLNLKCFSLTCKLDILVYDEQVVPLLYRMINLEKLLLNVSIHRSTFIDGNDLNDIATHMPKLNNFVFSIHSNLYIDDLIHLRSNEDIQRTFKNLEKYQIISYIDYFPNDKLSQCHLFSHSYTMNCLYRLTNSFPGGLFKFVHEVSLYDERPFEHEFFIRIAQAFPFLKTLTIDNRSSQNRKNCQQLNGDNRNLSIIEYPHLIQLRLSTAHDDYIEQFLMDTKTCLSNYIVLDIEYHCLRRVTHDFTRDTTRINCAKVKQLFSIDKLKVSKHFHVYFPHIEEL